MQSNYKHFTKEMNIFQINTNKNKRKKLIVKHHLFGSKYKTEAYMHYGNELVIKLDYFFVKSFHIFVL